MPDPNVVESPPAMPESSAVVAVAELPVSPAQPDDIGSMYEQYRELLLHVACRKFRVPDSDAENLIQEVFLAFMQNEAPVDDTKAWLVAAMCNASRHYWRMSDRLEPMPEDIHDQQSDPESHGLADRMALMLTLRKALRYMQPRCRETLYMHYYEGRSAVDIARDLETTTRYSEKLIHNCLKRMREIYSAITTVRQ